MQASWAEAMQTNVGRTLVAVPNERIEIEPGVWLIAVLHSPERGSQAIGVRLVYGSTSFDVVGDARALSHPPGQDIVFLSPRQTDASALIRSRPRWVVWADSSAGPARLGESGLRSIALRDVESASFASDGRRVVLK
jgi:hypothetical protein